jgi:hypothetical protein
MNHHLIGRGVARCVGHDKLENEVSRLQAAEPLSGETHDPRVCGRL